MNHYEQEHIIINRKFEVIGLPETKEWSSERIKEKGMKKQRKVYIAISLVQWLYEEGCKVKGEEKWEARKSIYRWKNYWLCGRDIGLQYYIKLLFNVTNEVHTMIILIFFYLGKIVTPKFKFVTSFFILFCFHIG